MVFPELERLMKLMGAPKSNWKIGSPHIDPTRSRLLAELRDGIEITGLDKIDVRPGKLLSHNGEQVVIYIKDTRSSKMTLVEFPEKSRRIHVAECEKIMEMRENGRFQRYVFTNRDDGKFLADWFERETREQGSIDAALKICKYCLRELNYCGYASADRRSERNTIWQSFHISDFFRDYQTFFAHLPSRKDTAANLNAYVEDWPLISADRRRIAGWKCDRCHVELSKLKRALHCHHKSGDVTDNSNENLSVLCAICHAEQPYHQHMKVPSDLRQKILKLRVEQRLA